MTGPAITPRYALSTAAHQWVTHPGDATAVCQRSSSHSPFPPHSQDLSAPAAEFDDTAPIADAADAGAQQCGCTNYCCDILPGQKPNMPFQVSCYGRRLQANKTALAEACAAAGVGPDVHALLVAMAMIETNHMCPT